MNKSEVKLKMALALLDCKIPDTEKFVRIKLVDLSNAQDLIKEALGEMKKEK